MARAWTTSRVTARGHTRQSRAQFLLSPTSALNQHGSNMAPFRHGILRFQMWQGKEGHPASSGQQLHVLASICAQVNWVFLAAPEKPPEMPCVWQRSHSSTYYNSRADRELISHITLLNSVEGGKRALCGFLLTERKDISRHLVLLKFCWKAVSLSPALSQKQNYGLCAWHGIPTCWESQQRSDL